MKLFVLEVGVDGYEASIKGVFTTEEKAEEFFSDNFAEDYWHNVMEYELDHGVSEI